MGHKREAPARFQFLIFDKSNEYFMIIERTWRVQEGEGDLFVCSVVGAGLTVGRRNPGVGPHTVGQSVRQRGDLYLGGHSDNCQYIYLYEHFRLSLWLIYLS